MMYKNSCPYRFALQQNEQDLSLIKVSSRGHVAALLSPYVLIFFVFTLALPMIFGIPSANKIIWYTVNITLIFLIYVLLTSPSRKQQKLLEIIAKKGVPVSAIIDKLEQVDTPESSRNNKTFYLVHLHFTNPTNDSEESFVIDVTPEYFDSLKLGQFISLRVLPNDLSAGVLEQDVQRYFEFEQFGFISCADCD